MKRCKATLPSKQLNLTGPPRTVQCGLPEHDGGEPHTVLIPSGVPWFPKAAPMTEMIEQPHIDLPERSPLRRHVTELEAEISRLRAALSEAAWVALSASVDTPCRGEHGEAYNVGAKEAAFKVWQLAEATVGDLRRAAEAMKGTE